MGRSGSQGLAEWVVMSCGDGSSSSSSPRHRCKLQHETDIGSQCWLQKVKLN